MIQERKKRFISAYKNEGGFTLIEVMISISILTIGLLAVASMQMSAIRGNNMSDNTTCALALAEDKMEELLGLSYSHADLANDPAAGNDSDLDSIVNVDHEEAGIGENGLSPGHFRRIWNIADNTPMSNNKTITVIVTWNEDKHKVSLSSIKRQ